MQEPYGVDKDMGLYYIYTQHGKKRRNQIVESLAIALSLKKISYKKEMRNVC